MSSNVSFAQYLQKNAIIISGTLNDVDSSNLLNEMSITLISGKALDPNFSPPESKKNFPIIIKNNHFKVVLPIECKYAYIQVNVTKLRDLVSSGFPLLVRGDSINIEFTTKKNIISGNHQDLIAYQLDTKERQNFTAGKYINNIANVSSTFNEYQSVISHTSLHPFLSTDINLNTLVKWETESRYRNSLFSHLYRIKGSTDTVLRKAILLELYNMNTEWITGKKLLLDSSLNYVKSVFSYFELKEMLKLSAGTNYFTQLFHAIKTTKQRYLRDKLLVYLFWRKYELSGNQGQFLISEALKIVYDAECKNILLQVANAKQKHSPAFPFELTDATGNIVKFSDFKGKALVIHFWFTGCAACMRLTEKMDPIIEIYKNNPRLKFLSISIDKNSSTWKTSVKSGNYNNPNEIPLFTQGLGGEHPLVKFYNLISYPRILVIGSDGTIVDANAPIITEDKHIGEFKNIINLALKK